jgi:hypothetical protein
VFIGLTAAIARMCASISAGIARREQAQQQQQ